VRPYQDFKAERILVPTDLGPHAEFAIRYALSVAHENRAQISFMHVVPLEEASQHDCRPVVDAAFRKLEKLIPDDANQWCEPELKVEIGNPAKELVRYAETERPDLIVLGLPADKKFNGHFRTGVTYNIVASAPCPVLTVRDLANDD